MARQLRRGIDTDESPAYSGHKLITLGVEILEGWLLEGRTNRPNTARVGLYSIGVNLLLVSLKASLAALSGSLALAADAIHSLVDVLASLVVLAGLLIARRRSSAFPYGLYKVENLVSVIMAILIFLAGYEIAREALLSPTREVSNEPLALAGVAVAILIAFLFSRFERRVARATNSPSLRADSRHFLTDVLSSSVVFVALLGSALGLPLDQAGAVVIVLFILWSGWHLLADGMRVLLDASLGYETLDQVRRVIAADPNVVEIRSLQGRNSGSYRFIEAVLTLRTHDLARAHLASERIESAIRESVPHVDRVLIHYEPTRKESRKWAVPLTSPGDGISAHFGEAPYFVLLEVGRTTGEVANREVLANPYIHADRQKGIKAAEFLIRQGIDGLVLRRRMEGRGPNYALDNAGVEVMLTEQESLNQVLEELSSAASSPRDA